MCPRRVLVREGLASAVVEDHLQDNLVLLTMMYRALGWVAVGENAVAGAA